MVEPKFPCHQLWPLDFSITTNELKKPDCEWSGFSTSASDTTDGYKPRLEDHNVWGFDKKVVASVELGDPSAEKQDFKMYSPDGTSPSKEIDDFHLEPLRDKCSFSQPFWLDSEQEWNPISENEWRYGIRCAAKGTLFIGSCTSALLSTRYDVTQKCAKSSSLLGQQQWICGYCGNIGILSGIMSCIGFVIATATFYHLNKGDVHQDKYFLVGIVSGIFMGLCSRVDLQTIMLTFMSWTILCALSISKLCHQIGRRGCERVTKS